MDEQKVLTKELPYTVVIETQIELSREVMQIIQKIYPDLVTGKNNIIQRLKKLVGKHPDVKQFRNYLAQAYLQTGDIEQARIVNEKLLEDHPDYLFARLFKADLLLRQGEPEQFLEMMGTNLQLHDLYPERNEFHLAEFMSYQNLAIRYFLAEGNIEEAEYRLSLMEMQDADHPNVETASAEILRYRFKNIGKLWQKDKRHDRRLVVGSYDKEIQATQAPCFNHPEIEVLYHNTLRIDPELISKILKLPRQTLLEDLHSVLDDAVRRYEYFLEGHEPEVWKEQFPLHALFLLADIGSEESLPHLFNFLRQGEELLDYWLSDYLAEDMWEIIYHCGHNQLTVLADFVKEPNNYFLARCAVATAVQQIALHQPQRKAEVMEWYRNLLQFLLENAENENITDTQLNSFVIWDIIPLGAEDFSELIAGFYEADLVDPDIIGDLEDVLRDIPIRRGEDYEKSTLFTDVYSRYGDVLDNWPYYSDNEDLEDAKPAITTNKVRQILNPANPGVFVKDQKPGRNDPCPCGSGKKYKKCCMEV